MTQSDVLIRYSEAKEALGGGCSDGYCCVEKPTGMHTNGGCKCASNPDFLRQQRMANIMRLAQEMSSEITRLRAALADAQAKIARLTTAASALVDFHNAPLECKRPDMFHRLISRLAVALDTPQRSNNLSAALQENANG